MIVRSSYLDVQISYYQENDELLNAYTIYLYSNEKNLIWSSDTCYADTALVTVPALMDRVTYYLQATGETVNGIEMQTEMIQFNCEYIKPDLFLKFRAENIPEEGAARLSSNFVLVEGKSIPETLVYISDEKVVLLPDQDGEKKVYFDDGYMADNFFCDIVVSDIPDFATIFVSNMKNAMCRITWNWGEFVGYEGIVYYAELVAYSFVGNETLNYIIRSNKIPPLEQGQQVFIWFRHRDGLFDIKIEALPMETQTIEVIEGGDVE